MRNKVLLALAVFGIVAGLVSAFLYGVERKPKPPVFNPAPNPYAQGIYANGIVESYQTHGENINIYPEVAGTVISILVTEGQRVARGTPLLALDDSVQRASVEQQKSQAEAALALLQELKAQPRRENLEVVKAQVNLAAANLKTAQDQLDKQRRSYELDPKSVSKDTLDTAENAVKVARPISKSRKDNTSSAKPAPGATTSAIRKSSTTPQRKRTRPRATCSPSTRSTLRSMAWCCRSTPPWAATYRSRARTTPTRKE